MFKKDGTQQVDFLQFFSFESSIIVIFHMKNAQFIKSVNVYELHACIRFSYTLKTEELLMGYHTKTPCCDIENKCTIFLFPLPTKFLLWKCDRWLRRVGFVIYISRIPSLWPFCNNAATYRLYIAILWINLIKFYMFNILFFSTNY